jgi:spermidine/putrescine transport system ATP-binding protein
MTMADTVAVMNEGRIEQMGAPEELYEAPATTFVANFLGQSNLVSGKVEGADGAVLRLDVHGSRVAAGKDRARVTDGDVWVGVRPEKVQLSDPGEDLRDSHNVLVDGQVSDVSFVGVSTQYLVGMPWGQELMVFAQNLGVSGVHPPGTQVDLSWDPAHTFALDGSADATAGAELDDGAAPLPVG